MPAGYFDSTLNGNLAVRTATYSDTGNIDASQSSLYTVVGVYSDTGQLPYTVTRTPTLISRYYD